MSENKYELPASFEEAFEHYHCPFYDNWGILSDPHVPFHNIPALTELINYFISKSVKAILINGDGMDCYSLSRFQPDPRKRKMSEEIQAMREFLIALHKWTGAKIFYKWGNHEERIEKHLIIKSPEWLGCTDFELENLLHLAEINVDYIKDQRIVYIGNLPIIHGHEIGLKSANVNPARSLFLKTYKSCMCGHLHRASQHNEQALDGKIISTWSTGHLGDPHPLYRRINNWTHGGARIEVDSSGDYEVINLRLIGNKIHRT
jgi:predicted phosphodiesterase